MIHKYITTLVISKSLWNSIFNRQPPSKQQYSDLLFIYHHLFTPKDQGFYAKQLSGDITALEDGLQELF